MNALVEAGNKLAMHSKRNKHVQIPGWNECCREPQQEARDAFLLWRGAGSPRCSVLFEQMRLLRSKFKLSVRQCNPIKNRN